MLFLPQRNNFLISERFAKGNGRASNTLTHDGMILLFTYAIKNVRFYHAAWNPNKDERAFCLFVTFKNS